MESVIFTSVIDDTEDKKVEIVDINNSFIQTDNPKNLGDQRDIIKIRCKLAQILVEIAPEMYGPYIIYENGNAVI